MIPKAILEADLLTQTHLVFACVAIVLGALQFAGRKGTGLHKTIGWSWVVAMVGVAGTSLFMRNLNEGGLSFTHAFTAWTAIGLPLGIMAARRGSILRHRAFMIALYVGGLVIAAFFTLTPGRLLHDAFLAG